MNVDQLLCAEHVIVDVQSNRLSLINLIDDVVYPQFPAITGRVSVLAILSRGDGELDEHSFTLTFTHNGEKLVEGPLLVDFQGSRHTRAILGISGLAFPGPGALDAILSLDGDELARYSMTISAAEATLDSVAIPAN